MTDLKQLLNWCECAVQGSAAAARTALLGAAGNLDARRKLELLLPGSELAKLLGSLPDVPPDYKYCVWDSGK